MAWPARWARGTLKAHALVFRNMARRAAARVPCRAQVTAPTALLPAAVVTKPCSHAEQTDIAGVALAPRCGDVEEVVLQIWAFGCSRVWCTALLCPSL